MRHPRLSSSTPLVYTKTEINGLLIRPDSRFIVHKAIEGRMIEVYRGDDYINLYHVFERMQKADPMLARLKIFRQQVGSSTWIVTVGESRDDLPVRSLDDGYDPKRGRYKRYAEQLTAGESLVLSTRPEAIKARRAWQLYVPKQDRRHLRSTVRKCGRGFAVSIIERDGVKR